MFPVPYFLTNRILLGIKPDSDISNHCMDSFYQKYQLWDIKKHQ